MTDKGRPLPKFGEWDVNDPSSAEGFTVIFNKARNDKKKGANSPSPAKQEGVLKQKASPVKQQRFTPPRMYSLLNDQFGQHPISMNITEKKRKWAIQTKT